MADFYFFTEPTKLADQTEDQAFGAVDENEFRITNMYSINADAKAFAVTGGEVLVQQTGTTDQYSIVLKPREQPDLNLPKTAYIIYTGIKKESIINGDKVADAPKNDFTAKIHDNLIKWYASENNQIPDTEPAANTSLGTAYSSGSSDPNYAFQDLDTLDSVFYSTSGLTLTTVAAGDHIADFDSSGEIGLIVIFDKIGYKPTCKLAREPTPFLSISPLPTVPTSAQLYKRKNQKEEVLGYIDSAAFFGAFYGLGLQVFDGSAFVHKKEKGLYTAVISKHFNKNRIYLDIRNESNDSFNYNDNYGDTIEISLDNAKTFVPANYLRNEGWPVYIIDDSSSSSEYDNANTTKAIEITMPGGDNEIPLLYYKKAFKEGSGYQFPEGKDLFLSPNIQNGKVSFGAIVPNVASGSVSADYIQLRYIRRAKNNATPANNFPAQGHSILKTCYFDNLFPIFDLTVPYDVSTGRSCSKIFYDVNFIDKEYINGANYTTNLGIGKDNQYTAFIAYPHNYNLNIQQNIDDKIPFVSYEEKGSTLFLINLADQIQSIILTKSSFEIGGIVQEYLKFTKYDSLGIDPIENYTFDDVTIVALTNLQFAELKLLRDQEFPAGYKVYLGIENIVTGIDDKGASYSKFEYVLRGLKEDGNGAIIRHTAFPSPAMEVYTDSKITEAEFKRNYEEAVGYGNFQDPAKTIRYEDYFLEKQPDIQQVVQEFISELKGMDTSANYLLDSIKSVVSAKGKALWLTAVQLLKADPTNFDDRPLYWARIKMAVEIKQHPLFLGDINAAHRVIEGSRLSGVLKLLEDTSRNYTGVDFRGAPAGAKKIVVTGFDPFQLSPDVYGKNAPETQNPSGAAALKLHGKTIGTAGNQGYIQTAIFPVRYHDFDKRAVEDLVSPYLENNSIDIIMSLSLNGDAYYFDLERFAGKARGGLHDNLNIGTLPSSAESKGYTADIGAGLEFYQTTLPVDKIITAAVTENYDLDKQKIFYDQSYIATNNDKKEHVNPTNGEPNTSTDSFDIGDIKGDSIKGSGSNYLSNEIFYRIARAREAKSSTVKTGHYHLASEKPYGTPSTVIPFTLKEIIKETENALIRCL